MIISYTHELVYIDIPKTASSTLDQVFSKLGETIKPKSSDGLGKHCREIPDNIKTFKKIISVRNPYSRMWSHYNMVKKYTDKIEQKKVPHRTFDEFLDFNIDNLSHPSDHWNGNVYRYFPIWKYIEPIGKIDHIIKMEQINKDLKDLGFNVYKKLPTVNKGKYIKNLQNIYTPERIEKVNIWAKTDFTNYGYNKNEIN